MTERKYEIGRWYPHDGGECPVPEETQVRMLFRSGLNRRDLVAKHWDWSMAVAFCVTEYPDEEETRTGRCWANVGDSIPMFSRAMPPPLSAFGTYTATLVNGEVQEIHWRKDQ
jgi:hypothetical protein